MRIKVLLVAVLLVSIVASAQNQKQEQTKQAEKDWVVQLKTLLVELRAVVLDRQGHLIDGLKKEDFEIREKGQPQEISSFAEERVGPLAIAQPTTIASVPKEDAPVTPPGEPTRSVVLFVDTLSIEAENVPRVKQTLKKFVDTQLTDHDAVTIITSSGMEGIPAHFTRDRALLHHFIDRIAVWGFSPNSYFTPSLAAAVRRDDQEAMDVAIALVVREEAVSALMTPLPILKQMATDKAGQVLGTTTYKRDSMLGTFAAASELMSRAPGQRVMFFFSDGFSLFDNRGNVESLGMQKAISRAARSGVVVYSICSKGLEAPAEFDAARGGVSISTPTGGLDPSLINRVARYVSASEKEAQDGMNALANDTGGRAFFNTNDMNLAMKKSLDGNNIYYAFSYYPATNGDGYREVTLRVKGHPEYEVRTQKGYFASDLIKKAKSLAKPQQQRLFDAIANPMPETALNVGAWAKYLEVENDSAQISIQVQVEGNRLTYIDSGDRVTLSLDVAAAVYDLYGKLVTSFIEKIKGGVPAASLNDVKQSGFSYGKRIPLKPGRYQVRVGVLDPETDNIGTASSWVEVPDLSKGKLALSSILLTAPLEAQPSASASGSQQLNAIKSYKSGGMLIYYLMLYNAPTSVGSDLMIQSELATNEKVVFESDPQPVSSRMMGKDAKGIEIGGQLKLALEPGFYELRLAIKDKSNHEFRRSVDFFVER
jgi:VWFA-related protein